MQRKFRLTRSTDFKRVRRTGKSYAHPFVVLVVQASEAPRVRVGVTVGRSVGGAVQRNRAKRLLREAIRPLLPDLLPGWDLILIARPALLPSKTLQEIRQVLISLLRRAQLIPLSDES
ncbi:MAG: ribonuclease P protein component [Anaerolineales bacterium]|nr:ribonuclease P protein component [Anaerolineales bacterium]